MIVRIRFKRIKTRLTFWFLIVALLPLATVSMIISQQRTRVIKETAFHKLTAIRDLKIDIINNWIDERIGDMQTIADDHEVRALETAFHRKKRTPADVSIINTATTLLSNYVKNYNAYTELFIIAHSGIICIATDETKIGKNKSKASYFTQPLETGKIYIKDIYYSKTIQKPGMTFSIPIYDLTRGTHIAGILVARIDLERSLYDLLMDRTGMGKTGETLIVNKDGLALSKLRWHRDAPLKLKIGAKPALLASQGKTGIAETDDYRGEQVLAAYTYIPRTKWGFVAKQDLKEVYASIQKMLLNIVIIFLISAAAVYLLAFFIVRNIVRPVHEMREVARRIQQGDLSARNHIMREDELGFLARSFNNMADSIGSQLLVQGGVADLNKTMVAFRRLQDFAGELLKQLIAMTGSNLGAFYLLTEGGDIFEHLTSVGVSPELLEPFDAASYEGEMGKAVAVKEITHIREIPEDTIFKFKTFAGTLSPREIITIPIVIDDKVAAVISLASLNPYSKEAQEILNQAWLSMNTAFSNLIASEQTSKLADELGQKNQELQAQSEELGALNEELQQQSEELQEQNVELETQKQQVEEADRLKSEFLSNMSHELRTPLNSVMALARVLIMQTRDKLSEEETHYLEIIERNGKQLLNLINDILDLSKIEAGSMDVRPRLFSPKTTIEMIVESLEPLAKVAGNQIIQKTPDNLPEIENDESRVHQILQNIIGNAVKFTKQGRVIVSASSDAEKVYIEVKDTGIGISERDLPHIFDEFRQVDGSASRMFEGTGLGLTIAHRTAKMLGGDIAVESVLGVGSTFTVTLPIKWKGLARVSEPVDIMPPAQITPERKTARRTGKNNRILLVEDTEAAVIQLRSILESEGFVVDVARNGEKALASMQRSIPGGVILDLMMPGVDGFEVLEKMSSIKATAKIPVLILTAKDLAPDDLEKLKYNNIQQLIQKGDVDRNELLLKIKTMMGVAPKVKPGTADKKRKITEPAGRKEKKPGAKGKKGAPVILVVEDTPDNMLTIKAVLKNRYKMLEANDGETGLQTALSELPGLILLDMSLPGMDGFEVVKKIKADEKTRLIPVIALTARVMKGDREEMLQAGCDDYISKPIDPKELLEKIEKWVTD